MVITMFTESGWRMDEYHKNYNKDGEYKEGTKSKSQRWRIQYGARKKN